MKSILAHFVRLVTVETLITSSQEIHQTDTLNRVGQE